MKAHTLTLVKLCTIYYKNKEITKKNIIHGMSSFTFFLYNLNSSEIFRGDKVLIFVIKRSIYYENKVMRRK